MLDLALEEDGASGRCHRPGFSGGTQKRVAEEGGRIFTFFSCVYAGMLVAAGELTGQIYKGKHPYDVAAIKIMVEEAGGKATDLAGKEQRYDQEVNGFIASNGLVHQRLVDIVGQLL